MYNNTIKLNVMTMYYSLKLNNIIGNKRINMICEIFNIHIHTLYYWLKIYIKHDSDLLLFIKNINFNSFHLLRNKIKFNIEQFHKNNLVYLKYKNTKVTNVIETFIINSITNNVKLSVKNIRINVFNKFNVKLFKGSIYIIFHKNNLTFKKLIVKTNPYSVIKQNEQRLNLINNFTNINLDNVISIDEMSFNLSSQPFKGWSPKGNKCIVNKCNKFVKGERYTITMAVSNNKIIDYTIVKGSLTTIKFTSFITKINNKYNNKILFIDNASIHKSKLFFSLIKSKNLKVIFNVPYHSEFNPIEYVFSMLRKYLINNVNDCFNDLHNLLKFFKLNTKGNKLNNIFNNCFNLINIPFL